MKIKTRRYYYYYFMRIGLFFMGMMPWRVALAVAEFGAKAIYPHLGKYKRTTLENLRTSLDVSREECERIALEVFVNLAKNGAEWIKLNGLIKPDISKVITESEGEDVLKEIVAEGRGVIALTAHFGNWELVGIFLTYLGIRGAAVARRIYFHKYGLFVENLRKRFGVPIIYRDESPKKFLRLLKEGKTLGLLADQDISSVDGVFVNFFDRPCFTPTAPIKLALATGAKVALVFMVRKPDNTHKMVVKGVLDPFKERKEEGVVEKYTQEWTDIFEQFVREYPEQWAWVHRRWKTKQREGSDS